MEVCENSIGNPEPEEDCWTLIKDHFDEEVAHIQEPMKPFLPTISTKGVKICSSERRLSQKRLASCANSPPPFNYHVTVEPEISGHDTIIRITKLSADDDQINEPTESNYFEIDDDDDVDELIYLSDSPPPVQKPVKLKRKVSHKRKVSLETIHEHESPPSHTPSSDLPDAPESDDDVVIVPKPIKKRKLEKPTKSAQEKGKDGQTGELTDVFVAKKGKRHKFTKLAHVLPEEKKNEKPGERTESPVPEEAVNLSQNKTEEENLEKPSLASSSNPDESEALNDEPVIIPKRNKKRKSKQNDSKHFVPNDDFDLSAPSWTVTVEIDKDDNYKVIDNDEESEKTPTAPDVIENAAKTLVKISEDSPKVIVIEPPESKKEETLSDSQSSTEKVEEDSMSVVSVEEQENMDIVEVKQVKSENGKRSKTMCVCPCGMMFSHRSGLSRHRRIVHLGMTYKCQMCGEHFTRSDSLNDHIKRLQHWNQETDNITPSGTPKRGSYKEYESHSEGRVPRKPRQRKGIIIMKKELPDGTQSVNLVEKSKNDSDSKCDDVQSDKDSDSVDPALEENTEVAKTDVADPEASCGGKTESSDQAAVLPKVPYSDEATSTINGKDSSKLSGGDLVHKEAECSSEAKVDYEKSTLTSKVDPSAVASLAAKLVQMGTRKLTLSSSPAKESEKIRPRPVIKEILCSTQIAIPQSTPAKPELAGQKSCQNVVQKNTENDETEATEVTVEEDRAAIVVSDLKDDAKTFQPTQEVSKPKALGQSSTSGFVVPTVCTALEKSMIRSVFESTTTPKQIALMSGARSPSIWTATAGMQASKTVQSSSLKPVTTQILVPSATSKPGLQSVKPQLTSRVPFSEEMSPVLRTQTVTSTVQRSVTVPRNLAPATQTSTQIAQAPVPMVQVLASTAPVSVPTAQTLAPPPQTLLPTAQTLVPVTTLPVIAPAVTEPPLVSSNQPIVTVPSTPQSQTVVRLSTPLLTQTIQQLITTPIDASTSSALPTNPTHALMETLLQSLMQAPIRSVSQAAEACTSVEIEIPVADAGGKETPREVMLYFGDALSEKEQAS